MIFEGFGVGVVAPEWPDVGKGLDDFGDGALKVAGGEGGPEFGPGLLSSLAVQDVDGFLQGRLVYVVIDPLHAKFDGGLEESKFGFVVSLVGRGLPTDFVG